MSAHFIKPGCTKCRACFDVCPTGSVFFGKDQFVIDADTCRGCAICVKVCPVDVIAPIVPQQKEDAKKGKSIVE